ncbi:MAG: hypothetical protein WDN02_07730 [Methylovirgula sp.]|uniref:hypothetical protein n=1 Tax=Methylovirgula sp. TaxID=1978224 RepID=UPI00307624E8
MRNDTLRALKNIGFETWFPADQVFPEEEEEYSATLKAVRQVYSRIPKTPESGDADNFTDPLPGKLYYLV